MPAVCPSGWGEYVTADNQPIKARNIKSSAGVPKGYYAGDLHDEWLRYCPHTAKGRYLHY
jgi:hypothetical protein